MNEQITFDEILETSNTRTQCKRIVTEMRTVENADGSKARVAFYKFAEVGA